MAQLPAGFIPSRVQSRPVPPPEADDGSVETGDIWRILRARRWTLLTVALLIALSGSAYALLARSLYTATAQILIDPRDRQIVDRSLIADAPAPDGGVTQVESQARLIESDSVLLRAIEQLDLVNGPEFGPSQAGAGTLSRLWARLTAADATPPVLTRDAAMSETLRALRRRLAVRRGDKTLVIDVVVSAHNPVDAARIADAIADAYAADLSAARERAARAAAGALSSRLEALHDRAKEADIALEAYKAASGFVGSNGVPVIDAQLTATNADLSAAKARADAATSRLEGVRAMQRDGLLATSASDGGSPVLSQLRTGAAAQAEALARLRVSYGPRHPAVLAAQAQLRHVQADVQAEVMRAAKVAEADADRALGEVASIQARLDELQAQSIQANGRSVRLRELQREADTDRSVYQSFLTRSGELAAQAGVDVANVRIISRPLPPRQSSWPPRALIVAVSAFAGLALGTAWALLREHLRPTVLSRAELKRHTGARFVGTVSAKALREVRPTTTDLVDLRDVATGATLLRLLRLQARPVRGKQARCIGIVSLGREKEERTRLAFLVAGAAARQGLRVVVIGTEAVAGKAAPTQETAFPALPAAPSFIFVPPAGAPGRVMRLSAGADGALSTPAAAKELLEALGEEFDVVIADLDDLVGSAQSAAIAAVSNDLVVVAREGRTAQGALKELADLADAGGRAVTAAVLVGRTGTV